MKSKTGKIQANSAIHRCKSRSFRAAAAALGIIFSLHMTVPLSAAEMPAPNALPSGGQIISGQGSVSSSGSNMRITQQSDKMIMNWQSFNIGRDASVNFVQPGSTSTALNRVVGSDPSAIFGSLTANGRVFLINPSGIIFGSTARVDVGGMVASTLNMKDSDFLIGSYNFYKDGTAGSINNLGMLTAKAAGFIAMLAPEIRNEGIVAADLGKVAFGVGEKMTLNFSGNSLLGITVEEGALNALIENKNLIQSDGGAVIMTARAANELALSAINNEGIVRARTIQEKNGVIVLDSGDNGLTTVSGALDASSTESKGGRIVATGERVLVKSGALLTASGALGGGEVLVGGSWQNSDTTVRQATGTVIESGALLQANATDRGDGGTVVAWSDITNPLSVTRAYGIFEAKGGLNEGNGGRIETSGHWLDVAGIKADASAVSGKSGLWLLDPYNVIIGAAPSGTAYANPFVPSADSTILASDIATTLQSGTSVTVTTGTAGSSIGDITVSSAITKASGDTDVTLTLNAANSIAVDQAISNTGGTGKLHVVLDADNNNSSGDGAGIVMLNADITTNGGNLSFGTGRTATINSVSTLVGGDVYVAGAGARTLSTNGGNVDVKGEMIIANTSGLTINSNNGNVRFYGLLNSGNSYTGTTYTGTWEQAKTNAASGTGSAAGDTYLATITSRLENAIAGKSVNYEQSWLGGRRVTGIGTNSLWRWVTGPEGLQDSGNGLGFFTQSTSGSGTAYNGGYSNWSNNEPNNYTGTGTGTNLSLEYESVLQFTGTTGLWNDLPGGPVTALAAHTLNYYVKETNLAASPLTINAGSGAVTFSGAVGSSKALASLNVTSTNSIAINGGAVTTEGLQTYTGNVTLGSASTILTQTTANTDFTLQSAKSITNASSADASLTIKTTGNIIMDTSSSISSSTGKLNTVLWSDTDANGGAIVLKRGSSIVSNGGDITLSGGANTSTGYAQGINNSGNLSNGITIISSTLNSGGGNITLRGKGAVTNNVAGDKGAATTEGIQIAFENGGGDGQTNLIDSGTGKVNLAGVSQATGGDGYAIEFSDAYYVTPVQNNSTSTIRSASTAADAIVINGDASASNGANQASGFYMGPSGSIFATGSGGGIQLSGTSGLNSIGNNNLGLFLMGNILASSGAITLTGTGGSGGTNNQDIFFYGIGSNINGSTSMVGYKAGTAVAASSSNITLNANTIYWYNDMRLQSTGNLIIQPRTAGTTIGIAGGAGSLGITATNFSTNFTNGFSGITIGNATAGDITIGNAALTYNDPLTLKTAGNITSGSAISLTGSAGQTAHLTLWSDADANNNGYIYLYDGSAISTNGGDITMAGGADGNSDGRPDGYATATATYSGVSIGRLGSVSAAATTIQSGGGNIFIKGKSTAGAGNGMGINFSHQGTLDAGSGTVTMIGESSSYAGIELSAWLDNTGVNSFLDINGYSVDIRGTSSNTNYHGLASSQLNNEYTRITAGAGGIYLYGYNTANTSKGVEISLNATTTGGGNITVESPNYVAIYAGANAHSFNAGAGNTTLKTNILSIGANHTFSGSGALTIEPYTAARAINIGTTGAGALDIASSYFSTNFTNGFSGITVGNATAGAITVGGATTLNDSTTLRSNSTIAINGAITANENLLLTGNGAITQSAALAVTGTTSITAGAANNVTLTNTSNNFTGMVSVVSGNNVSIIDSNAMTLGAITSSGLVDIATLTGDLTLSGAVSTANATANAIKLNTGKSTAAGTSTGGNIIVSGGTVSVGAGGTAQLFTGSVTGSTGLTALVGSGSNRFRYNSDESAANYTTALGTGLYALYREQPTVTVTASDASKTYDGLAYSGGNGVTTSGFVNGDTSAALGGTLAYGGTSQSAINAGTYTIVPSGYTNGLGYAMLFVDGALTITGATSNPYVPPTPPQIPAQQQSPATASAPIVVQQAALPVGMAVSVVPGVTSTGGPAILTTTTQLQTVTEGQALNQPLAAEGGTMPYTWRMISGSLPQGVTLDPLSGELRGTPFINGIFPFEVEVIDSKGNRSARKLLLYVTGR